ncbi:hypothetical protein ACGFI9_14400 [Micromonospora sp. NPDC048930]|uniref:hypothetical protein n=1 Tax=Micromonospora sp. NPDC048930 TaxID=3364261 RepID=UPI003713A4A7
MVDAVVVGWVAEADGRGQFGELSGGAARDGSGAAATRTGIHARVRGEERAGRREFGAADTPLRRGWRRSSAGAIQIVDPWHGDISNLNLYQGALTDVDVEQFSEKQSLADVTPTD